MITFKLRCDLIRQAYEQKKKHDPAHKGLTVYAFSEQIGIGESTFKKFLGEQATDAMCSTLFYICKALRLDPAILLGLSQGVDFDRIQPFNAIPDKMVLDEKTERIEAIKGYLEDANIDRDRLRKLYLAKTAEASGAEERIKALEEMLASKEESIKRHDAVLTSNTQTIKHLTEQARKSRRWSIAMALIAVLALAGLAYYLFRGGELKQF